MFFLPTIMINLVLTKHSGPKHHAVAVTVPIFASFSVCHTGLSGRAVAKAAFPPLLPSPVPTLISLCSTLLSQPWADLPQICGQSSPQAMN
jgi:hypothetical protein